MPAAAAGLSGTTYSTTNPSPLDRPSCSLTTVGTCDVSTPRKTIGTLGAFSCPPGGAGGCGAPGGCGGVGGVCAKPPIGSNPKHAMIAMNFIFMVCLVKSLTGNGNEDYFLARVRDAKRCASGGITPLPCLLRLITKAPQWLP